MYFPNAYFITGTAYAGKSTMIELLARTHDGILCEENYHNAYLCDLDKAEFPGLTYTRDLLDWHDFVRRTPDEYEAWIHRTSKECEILELEILAERCRDGRPVFVDTNISLETLRAIADPSHVLIMLADPDVSVNRFFNRPDREKQFLYRLMMEEPDPQASLENFRQCLARINSRKNYEMYLNSGFQVLLRDDSRSIEDTLHIVERLFGLT
ncbi:MAG: hypothetical protein IKU34_00965 [Clostridia bacterium]|nr:hypothetical protein [Clostridia bacterium]